MQFRFIIFKFRFKYIKFVAGDREGMGSSMVSWMCLAIYFGTSLCLIALTILAHLANAANWSIKGHRLIQV